MSVPEFGITYIGRRLLLRLFATLALVPVVVVLLFFLPLVAAAVVLVIWVIYLVLFYRSAWRFFGSLISLLPAADV